MRVDEWLPEGWTWHIGRDGTDTLAGPKAVEPDGRWWQPLAEVTLNPAVDMRSRWAQPFRLVYGWISSEGPEDWPDVTAHSTLGSLVEEFRAHIATPVTCERCGLEAWEEGFGPTLTVFCVTCDGTPLDPEYQRYEDEAVRAAQRVECRNRWPSA